jgi:hypothetical protein
MTVQAPVQAVPAPIASSSGKSHIHRGISPNAAPAKASAPDLKPADLNSRTKLAQVADNNLTAVLSPIQDQDQAAAATQHARLLIQAQPRAAMVAQANSHSQSVQRLLQ